MQHGDEAQAVVAKRELATAALGTRAGALEVAVNVSGRVGLGRDRVAEPRSSLLESLGDGDPGGWFVGGATLRLRAAVVAGPVGLVGPAPE